MSYSRSETQAVRETAKAVAMDLSLEHLQKPEEVLWDFALEVCLDKACDQVPVFLSQHAREVRECDCFFLVEHLESRHAWRLGGVDFLPPGQAFLPEHPLSTRPEVVTVAKVSCAGTSSSAMVDRAKAQVERALRAWRVAMLAQRPVLQVHPDQLRFRVGDTYAFSKEQVGWARDPGKPHSLEIDGLQDLAGNSSLLGFTEEPTTAWQRSVHRSLNWLERAALAVDPLDQLLFGFFALEAILGDSASGLKADVLAMRRLILDHVAGGSFANPVRLWFLYDAVRSSAVHGEESPELASREASAFLRDIALAVRQAVELGGSVSKKSELHRLIDGHESVPELVSWMRASAGTDWEPILLELESKLVKLSHGSGSGS